MTLEILVSSALMGYTMDEQTKILSSIETGSNLPTARLREGAEKVIEIFDDWEPTVEGYAGFPVEREAIQKKKDLHKDDRNVGRVVSQGGSQYVITGKKADGRYIVVGKKGEKTAKDAGDIGVTKNEAIGIDIEDLHNLMVEKKMDGVDDNGFTKCWKGYKKRGTKMKGGKEVNNCVKEEKKDLPKNKMFRKMGNLGRDIVSKHTSDEDRQKKYDRQKKMTKVFNKANEEVEQVDELYKGKHGQSEKEYQDSRSDAGKMVSGDSKRSGSAYSSRATSSTGPNPAGGSQKPKGQGRMTSGARTDLLYRKAMLKKQEAEKKKDK